jgi:ribonuclease P protein component
MPRYTFKKTERLSSKKDIEQLVIAGKAFNQFPFRVIYFYKNNSPRFPVKIAISVAKKKFKRAVDRNRIKRLTREAYRLSKHVLIESCTQHQSGFDLLFVYNGSKDDAQFNIFTTKINLILHRLIKINEAAKLESHSTS